jgi:hypothetical protein
MAVNLSPVGGVAGQFFDNNGNPLSGGKIFTYVAGTTTNQVTYTSAAGVIAHSNPIILDSGGRVPSGEIWLTDGLQYKFVIQSSTNQLIGTFDNISGINSNFVNYTIQEEIQTATAGQTVFTLTTMSYSPATNSLSVFVDGVNQYEGGAYSYIETSSTTVTFTAGLHVGAEVKFTTAVFTAGSVGNAANVVYDPAGVGAVPTNVQDKLRETVSVKDFGAVGDGVTDDATAFQNAVSALPAQGGQLYIPAGTYLLNSTLNITNKTVTIIGSGQKVTELQFGSSVVNGIVFDGGAQSSLLYNIFVLKSLRITTNNTSGGGTAVTVRNNGASGSAFTSAIISEIDIKFENTGASSYSIGEIVGYWSKGILLENAGGTVIEKCFIQGQNAAGTPSTFKLEQGIEITGSGDPTVYSINDTQIYWADIGLSVTNTNAEGIYVRGCTFVNVNIGVNWDTASPQIQFEWSQGHISSRKRGFALTNLSQFSITDSMFQLQSSPGGNYFDWDCLEVDISGAILFGAMSNCVVISDDFINPTTGLPIIKRGVVVASGGGMKIHNNWFFNMTSAIVFGAAVTGCWSLGNQFVTCPTTVSDPTNVNFGQHLNSGTLSIGTEQSENTFELKGSFSRGAPVTKTGSFTLSATENHVYINSASPCVVTLPSPVTYAGREVTFINRNSQPVTSSSFVIIDLSGASSSTILPATIGVWVTLVSDGVAWQTVAGG